SAAAPGAPSWPVWGGALNSAAQNGAGFFDRNRSLKFVAAVDTGMRRYVVKLNSRAFLPLQQVSIFEILRDVEQPQQAYIQFNDHPAESDRSKLALAGIDLLAYISGYAWLALGTPQAFESARELTFVRAVARVDPRD